MKISKKSASVSLVLAACTTLTACGGSSHDDTNADTTPSISTATRSISNSTTNTTSTTDSPTSTKSTKSDDASATSGNTSPTNDSTSATSSSGVSVPVEDPATDPKKTPAKNDAKSVKLNGVTLTLPSGLDLINSDGSAARLMRDDSVVVMLSSATGIESLGPLAQRCQEAGQNLVEATKEHAKPKISVTTKGQEQICSVTIDGTLEGQKSKGVITMYDVLDAKGTDYTINVQDFSKAPSSKDADALKDSLLASLQNSTTKH